MPIIIKLITTL